MLNEAICSVCGAVQAGGGGPGLNFVFTLETGTGTTEVLYEDVCNVLGARFQKPNPALIIIYQTTENMQP